MSINKKSLFNIFALFIIFVLIVLIILPFNVNNLEQAQRIAVWKSKFEQLKYCFSLVDIHENLSEVSYNNEDDLIDVIKPYFNIQKKLNFKYSYRRMNGRPVKKTGQFYFDTFYLLKDGSLISLKKNISEILNENQPLYFMFVDLNGTQKPNRIGRDIFLISIFNKNIQALGHDRPYSALKTNCSPIGSGVYCNEYYLIGGRF